MKLYHTDNNGKNWLFFRSCFYFICAIFSFLFLNYFYDPIACRTALIQLFALQKNFRDLRNAHRTLSL